MGDCPACGGADSFDPFVCQVCRGTGEVELAQYRADLTVDRDVDVGREERG